MKYYIPMLFFGLCLVTALTPSLSMDNFDPYQNASAPPMEFYDIANLIEENRTLKNELRKAHNIQQALIAGTVCGGLVYIACRFIQRKTESKKYEVKEQ
jgi:hypothetical protein